MKAQRFETEYAGKKVIIETGRLAQQASAAVTVQMGETVVMATVTMSTRARPIDFFPLMVDYEERFFAAGKIKGPRFTKREGRPSTQAVLTSRMIDRGLRPLFQQDMRNDIQLICLPLCLDYENRPDIVSLIAACTAIHLSEIPFDGPVVGARVCMLNGEYMVNPTSDELEFADLQMVLTGDGERITMVDCDADEMADTNLEGAFKVAMEAMGPMAKFIDDIRAKVGKPKASGDALILRGGLEPEDLKIVEEMKKAAIPHLDKYLFNNPKGSKGERKQILQELKDMLVEDFKKKLTTKDRPEDAAEKYAKDLISSFFFDFIEEQVTKAILEKDKRVDGRALDQIRPLEVDVGLLPRTHGSGVFSRGETQTLSVVTLGAPFDMLSVETMEDDKTQKYFHHYNFLPYSVGEVKPLRGASRRDLGHGALAEKALMPVLPADEDFPYTVRVVSEIMGSNGSSSMGATCGSTISLMDAGVPIKKPVAGIAMGMASDGKKWKILTDIQDMEDGPGGMDFKFTGTRDGITAIQMDTKTRGLNIDMIKATFPPMRKAINEILDAIEKVIPEPRKDLSKHAPRIIHFMIDPEKIRDVIGPGGKVIRAITDELDLKIDINDDGMVMITTNDMENGAIAEKKVKDIVREIEVGEIFEEAEVVKIMPFGAFCNLTPGTDGMLHVSEIEWGHVDKVTDRVNLGDKLKVKVIKIERGKIDVSLKALIPKPEGYVEKPRRSSSRFSRDGDRRRSSRDGDRRSYSRDSDRRSSRDGDRRSSDRSGDRRSSGRDGDRKFNDNRSSGGDRRPERSEDNVNRDGYSKEKKDPRLDKKDTEGSA